MPEARKVFVYTDYPGLKKKRVAAYCRVSTTHDAQLDSLSSQIEYYQKYVSRRWDWELVGIYSDVQSGKNVTGRRQFKRMLDDCQNKRIDMIITKSISRFGRNTAEVLDAINNLRLFGVEVYFETENISTSDTTHDFLISILQSVAQAESESRSQNIKWDNKRKLENGSSKMYGRLCFGYQHDAEGELAIKDDEAQTVRFIFDLYLSGFSVLAIKRYLESHAIKSPTGRDTWPKRTIDTILGNEKYTGTVLVGKTYCGDFPNNRRIKNQGQRAKYQMANSHPAIVPQEQYDRVQLEKSMRSNIQIDSSGKSRKCIRYSMKREQRNEVLINIEE